MSTHRTPEDRDAGGNRAEATFAGAFNIWRLVRAATLFFVALFLHGGMAWMLAANENNWSMVATFPLSLLGVGLFVNGAMVGDRAKKHTLATGEPMSHRGGLWQFAGIALVLVAWLGPIYAMS